jgi:hypothetical protein
MFSARRARAVIVPSASVADDAKLWADLGARYGDPEESTRLPAARSRGVRRSRAERYDCRTLPLSLGTREPGKNRQAILWAIRYWPTSASSPHLAVVGQAAWGAERKTRPSNAWAWEIGCTSRATSPGRSPALYNGASVFLFPSLYEASACRARSHGLRHTGGHVQRSALPEVAGDAAILVPRTRRPSPRR